MKTVAILNPRSGGGKAAEAWRRAQSHLNGPREAHETTAPGDATALTARAIKDGATTIVAVGGDGTINEVVNGFFEQGAPIAPHVALAIVPCGTGSDFRRTLDIPLDPTAAAAVIERGRVWTIDLMHVRYTTMAGAPAMRYSMNVTSFGMGGVVAARANRSSKPLGARLAFLVATLQTALSFRGDTVRLELDGASTVERLITNVAVGNGQYHGAGMWVCPAAVVDDGQLHVTVVKYLPLIELLRNLPRLYDGSIYGHPKVESYSVTRIAATSARPSLVEIDGEALGRLPLEITVVPKALRVLAP